MKVKQTLKALLLGGVLTLGAASVASAPVLAQECGGVQTAIISCEESGEGDYKDTGIWYILKLAIQILTGLIAVAALFGIVYGAILYTSAGPNQEQIKKAKNVFTSVVIGILAYALMVAALNFLIPGGVLSSL